MKKLAIAGSAVAFAALPMAGVFAATGNTMTDTLNVTIASACDITTASSMNNVIPVSIGSNETKSDIAGTAMTINCNNYQGWTLTAKGAGTGGTSGHEQDIYSAEKSATISGTSAAASYWKFKLTGTTVKTGNPNYTDFQFIPDATTGATVADSQTPSTGATVTPTYQIVTVNQAAGDDYTGAISYTLAANPSS